MYGFVYCLDNFLAMPGLYKGGPKSADELPNPYHEHPWLNAEP